MSRGGRTLRLATRGSALALQQASLVAEAVEQRRHEVEIVEVETRGDQIRDELIHRLGRTGAFVRALDERVIEGDVDAAVHSMKDMPTEMPDPLVVAAVPERAYPGDLLVTPDGATLEELPTGATIGTASLRRRAEILARRSDVIVEPIRGNVDTRIEKLLAPHRRREHDRRIAAADQTNQRVDPAGVEEAESEDPGASDETPEFDRSVEEWVAALPDIQQRALNREVDAEYDAVVLAEAGLERAGLLDQVPTHRLTSTEFVPAPGQGALAVTALDDETAELLHDVVDHPRTRVETTVERTVLAELGGGCVAPIGVHAVIQGEHVHCVVRVLSSDGTDEVSATRDLPATDHAEAARELARALADRGAAELVAAARGEAQGDAGRDG